MAPQGDPRVLFVLNAVLSGLFSLVVVWGFSVIEVTEFSWTTVLLAAVTLMVLTWVVVLR